MKIGDWQEALDHLTTRIQSTTTWAASPRRIVALPGETFYDPTGWRFALVWDDRVMLTRVGPRGGIEDLFGLSRDQITYFDGLLRRP